MVKCQKELKMMKERAVSRVRIKRSRRTKIKVPRSFKISEDDVFNHRGTTGCPGCSAVKRNMAVQPHTQE
eukprot:8264253-Karenia_brevis.AAC.1